MAELAKKLKLNTGVLSRITRDLVYDRKEIEEEIKRSDQFSSGGADESRMKIQQNVISEAKSMLPDSKLRLQKQLTLVQGLLKEAKGSPAIDEKLLQIATAAISEAEQALAVTD